MWFFFFFFRHRRRIQHVILQYVAKFNLNNMCSFKYEENINQFQCFEWCRPICTISSFIAIKHTSNSGPDLRHKNMHICWTTDPIKNKKLIRVQPREPSSISYLIIWCFKPCYVVGFFFTMNMLCSILYNIRVEGDFHKEINSWKDQ